MKRVFLTFMVFVAGLSATALDLNAQGGETDSGGRGEAACSRRKGNQMHQWKKDMEEFRARSNDDRRIQKLTDSIAAVQAGAALRNLDFVLEADNIQLRSGINILVNSTTNFISVKGDRAVVQIASNSINPGPNGMGGITVDGIITDRTVKVDKKGRTSFSMNVNGIGINAEIELYMSPGTNKATATVYPNFNSNTLWLQGTIVPYESSKVIEGKSL